MTVPEYVAHARELLKQTTGEGTRPWCYEECGQKGSSIAIGITHPPVSGEYDEQRYYDDESDTYAEDRPLPVDNVAEINNGNRHDAVAIVAAHNDLVPRLCAVVEAQRIALEGAQGQLRRAVTHGGNRGEMNRACSVIGELLAQPIDAFTTEDGHD